MTPTPPEDFTITVDPISGELLGPEPEINQEALGRSRAPNIKPDNSTSRNAKALIRKHGKRGKPKC